jgi:hypothetical protein
VKVQFERAGFFCEKRVYKNDNRDNLRGNQLPAALKENIKFNNVDKLIWIGHDSIKVA